MGQRIINKLHDTMIKECLEHEELLTEWEIEFIDSIAKQIEYKHLSKKQEGILNRINSRVIGGR